MHRNSGKPFTEIISTELLSNLTENINNILKTDSSKYNHRFINLTFERARIRKLVDIQLNKQVLRVKSLRIYPNN